MYNDPIETLLVEPMRTLDLTRTPRLCSIDIVAGDTWRYNSMDISLRILEVSNGMVKVCSVSADGELSEPKLMAQGELRSRYHLPYRLR